MINVQDFFLGPKRKPYIIVSMRPHCTYATQEGRHPDATIVGLVYGEYDTSAWVTQREWCAKGHQPIGPKLGFPYWVYIEDFQCALTTPDSDAEPWSWVHCGAQNDYATFLEAALSAPVTLAKGILVEFRGEDI